MRIEKYEKTIDADFFENSVFDPPLCSECLERYSELGGLAAVYLKRHGDLVHMCPAIYDPVTIGHLRLAKPIQMRVALCGVNVSIVGYSRFYAVHKLLLDQEFMYYLLNTYPQLIKKPLSRDLIDSIDIKSEIAVWLLGK